jgi:ectoine hydroxylase-related dioxygenase (phytanoyl-CoA dioxygenase family)
VAVLAVTDARLLRDAAPNEQDPMTRATPFAADEETAVDALLRNGYAIVRDVISVDSMRELIGAVEAFESDAVASRQRDGRVYALRNLLSLVPAVQALADSPGVRALVEPVVGPGARAVRGLLFDKTPAANWKVAWHQDLSIAVKRRIDVPGFGPWSVKAGVQHVQPPVEILQNMLTVRLHLDDCGQDNGPLKVIPGSHAAGVLNPAEVEAWRQARAPVSCCVGAGGVVLMRPLLLHASSSAAQALHRRVVHLEYAGGELPRGLEWEVG